MAVKTKSPRFPAILLITIIFIGGFIGGHAYSLLMSSVTISSSGQIGQTGNDVYAASGYPNDIQAAVNSISLSGGTVHIPAGTFNWNHQSVNIPGGVNIMGASPAGCNGHEANWTSYTATTILHNSAPPFYEMFNIDGSNGKPVRISGIQFECDPLTGGDDGVNGVAILVEACINYRIDHCTFINFPQMAVYVGSSNSVTSRGVIDHCVVDNPYKLSGSGWLWGYGFYAGNDFFKIEDWDSDITHFAGRYDNMPYGTTVMVVEDCHFSRCRHATDGITGAWGIIRFNLVDNSIPPYGDIDSHGSASWVSARGFEVYNNTMIQTPADDDSYGNGDIAVRLRDGSGLIYNNTFIVSPSNTGRAYFIYLDDDDDYYGNYPITKVSQTYIWSNTYTGSSFLNNRGGYTQNVDYFLRAPTQAQDGFTYAPYTYPHPLTLQS
ncbi:MAG: hypothetical protein NWE99_10680 [Candidatus Bathyarchaeota archaeon]|nr:hypothetical protein [Candidatus Bathyarchaeota archaeon]